jgi:hypothetical protein
MNAILGQAYLPTGALPMTSVIMTVRSGRRPWATARRRGSTAGLKGPLAQLADYVAQAGVDRSHLQMGDGQCRDPRQAAAAGTHLGFGGVRLRQRTSAASSHTQK